MPTKTKDELKGLVDSSISAKISGLTAKSDTDLSGELSGWVTLVNRDLSANLTAAATAGRSFYMVESPVFINPGKLHFSTTKGSVVSGKDLKLESTFRAYLKSLYDPKEHFAVDRTLKVTEILPPRMPITFVPSMPQNVVFRYTISWA